MVLALPCYGALALAALLSAGSLPGAVLSCHTRRCLLAAAVFFGYVIARALFSPAEYLARIDLYMVLGGLMIYVLFTLHLTSPRLRMTFVIVLLLLAVANCAIGANQYLKQKNFMPFDFLPRVDYGNRASGFYGCPNHLAGFLEVVFFMSLSVALWSQWRVAWKILAGYVGLVCTAGILITGSRGGYVSTLTGLAVFCVVSFHLVGRRFLLHPWLLRAVAVLVALALAFAVYAIVLKTDLANYRVQTASTDSSLRLLMSRSALQQFLVNPLFGTGSGTYLFYGRLFRYPEMQLETTWAHDDILQFLGEYGILGVAGFLAFLIFHLRTGWKAVAGAVSGASATWLSGSNSLALSLAALSSVAALLVHSFLDFNLHVPANTLLMAFVFALLANPGDSTSQELASNGETAPRFSRGVRIILPLLGLWMLVGGLPTLPAEYYGERARKILVDGAALQSEPSLRNAESFATRALQYDSRNPRLHYYLGEARVALAEVSTDPPTRERLYLDSIAAYRDALKLTPQDASLHVLAGASLDSIKQFDEADPHFQRALALDPNSGFVRWTYAAHLESEGKLDAAEAEYKNSARLGMGWAAYSAIERLAKDRKAKAETGDPASKPSS